MLENLSLFITAGVDWGVTCYERGREEISMEIMDNMFVGASSSELRSPGRERPRSDKGLEGVEVSERWNVAPIQGRLRNGG